ncbi:MAG: HAD family hydrolase [Rhodospirillaceae bacterium]|nr:HAD family hydrolase [Rhodospirillaceae bacterium]
MIAVFDLDRTITTHGTFTPWLFRFIPRRPWRLIALPFILVAAIGYKLKLLTRKDLKQVMLKCVTTGVSADEVARVNDIFVRSWIPRRCRPGALKKIEEHRKNGDLIVLATASNDIHAIPIAKALGIEHVVATRAEVDAAGRLTGRILGPNCYGTDKLDMIKAAVAVGDAKTIAYSDHHSDLPMLEWAGQGVAVNPNAKLRAIAEKRGMEICNWNA